MTLFMDYEMKCSVCGNNTKVLSIASSNQLGYKDLDTRPSEMYRSTMHTWVSECLYCGYVSYNLEVDLEIDPGFLESEEYKTCNGIDFKSDLSRKFYKEYLIENKKSNDKISAFQSILRCAWACDDDNDIKNAVLARKIAIECIEELIESHDDVDSFIVLKSDLLRRSGQFDRLIREYENLTLNDEMLNKIIRFQVEKAHEKDSKCYTLEVVS